MASTKSSKGSARTAPKGRATRARNDDRANSMFGPTVQWLLVILAIAAVLGGLMYLFRDVTSPLGGGGHSGAPAVVVDDAPSRDL